MNFFEQQARARRRTYLLLGYFCLAVIAIVAAVSSAVFLMVWWASDGSFTLAQWWASPLFAATAGGAFLLIIVGSLHKAWQLRGGGTALAHMLGAREVAPQADGAQERRYRNVVEEMAIASGIPAPRTFVLDNEPAINAFVAGYRPTEAVVVITEGTLKDLDRDELQGVIAHEFSHVFNADMNLNMRLLAVLSGILLIGRMGEFLLRSLAFGGRRRTRSSGRGDARGYAIILAVGLILMVIGYIGLFFGRLIKAAIARQRELLADASSVQFTRNPAGIAGALIKIRNGPGAGLDTSHAEDMSHMCFGQAVHYKLQGLLATHPPVDERLAAIGPEWAARARVRARTQPGGQTAPQAPASAPEGSAGFASGGTASETAAAAPNSSSQRIGTVAPQHMGYAASLISVIPEQIREDIRSPRQAQLVVFALALSASNVGPDNTGLDKLAPREMDQVADLRTRIAELGTRLRLPLVDLAMPALKQLSQSGRDNFLAQLQKLVEADRKLTLFEYTLTALLREHLKAGAERSQRVRFRRYAQVQEDIHLVFSALAHASGQDRNEAASPFKRMTAALLSPTRELLPVRQCRLDKLDQALGNLRDLTPLLKGPLVDAMGDLVLEDGKVQVAEAELLRAVCTLLDCPVPPLTGHAA